MYKFIDETTHSVAYVRDVSILRLNLHSKKDVAVTELSISVQSKDSDNMLVLSKVYSTYDDALNVLNDLQKTYENTIGTYENKIIIFNY